MSGIFETQQKSWDGWTKMEEGEMVRGEVRKVMRDSSEGPDRWLAGLRPLEGSEQWSGHHVENGLRKRAREETRSTIRRLMH